MMKIFLASVGIAVLLVVTTESLRIRPTSCRKPTPAGCDKRNVCRRKRCSFGQTCQLLCGTCRPVCVGQTCRRGCPKIYRPVCGTDGKTYANQCILKIATCESNGRIRKRSNGKCSCVAACPFIYDPVCGTNGKTYANDCVLKAATCQSNGLIQKKHHGRCRPQCADACITLFKPVCGSDGKTYSNSCFLGIASCQSGGKIRQVGEGPCPPRKG